MEPEVKTAEKGTVENQGTDLKGAEVRDNLDTQNKGATFEPLFKNEAITDAQLKGEDDAAGEIKADPEPKGDDTKKADTTDEKAKLEADAKADAEVKAKAEADAKKPELPKEVAEEIAKKEEHIAGLTTAVGKERQNVKILKQEIQRLTSENITLKQPKEAVDKEADKFKDFKVLTDEDYENLVDEDPDAATKYLYKFNKYQEYQSRIKNNKANEGRQAAAEKEIVDYGIQELEKILPGITHGRSDLAPKLTEFAIKHGLDDAVLSVITDPRTKIITPNGENLIIGDGAAQVVSLIKSAYDALSKIPDRKTIEAELRPVLEAEIQKEIIKKLKQDPSMSGYRSLDQIAGSGGKDVKPFTGAFTETDYSRLTEDEKRAALGG